MVHLYLGGTSFILLPMVINISKIGTMTNKQDIEVKLPGMVFTNYIVFLLNLENQLKILIWR